MRKVVAALAGLLLASMLLNPARAGTARTEEEPYTIAEGMVVFNTGAEWSLGTQYISFKARGAERHVDFKIRDDSGMRARGHIWVDRDDDGAFEKVADFCNETTKPFRIRTHEEILIGVIFGTCRDGTPSLVTQGTVTATFSR